MKYYLESVSNIQPFGFIVRFMLVLSWMHHPGQKQY